MNGNEGSRSLWWSQSSIQISHPELDPIATAQALGAIPEIAQSPGKSKVPHGTCKSAGYLCFSHRVDEPGLPDVAIQWTETFVAEREEQFHKLLSEGCNINVYIGIHTSILALGFVLPATLTLWRLGIPLGVEFFSS